MTRKYFGTDGIRGEVGKAPITADFVMKLGWAAGKTLSEDSVERNIFLIGKDTRVSGYMLESALEAGLIAAGADVGLLGPMPTPAIAYLTNAFHAAAGIVISASHNPHEDNGIKFFSGDGYKLPDATEKEMESWIDQPLETNSSSQLGKAFRIADAPGRYIEFCKGTVPRWFSLAGMRIVVDCGNGATYHIAPKVMTELGATVIAIGTQPDGFNINRGCGSTSPEVLQKRVVEESADLGIAFDGDGDRVQFVDRHGNLADGDQLIYIIATHMQRQGKLNGIVGTQMSNLGLEMAAREFGVPFVRTKVGDRYVIEAMKEHGYKLGGESSGHIICSDMTSTGDGIVAALQVLHAIAEADSTLEELLAGMVRVPQVLVNVRVSEDKDYLGNPDVMKAVDTAEKDLGSNGRVLLRASGTEPLIRVMVEGLDDQQVRLHAESIADQVRGLCR